MKKVGWIGYLLVFLWAEISFMLLSKYIYPVMDTLCLKLIGKAFSQRGSAFQVIVLTLAALLAAFVLWKILQYQNGTGIIVVCSVMLVVILLSVICAYQTIRRDDYWEIHDAALYGFPGFIRYEYLNVNGRYFSLFLKSFYSFFQPTVYINVLLTFNILMLCGGFIYLLKSVIPEASRIFRMLFGVCLAMGTIFMSPNVWEVWFWGGGTLIYGVGITLLVWAAAVMIQLEVSSEHRALKTLSAAFCIICACGTSELITASLCVFSLMILLLPCLLYRRSRNKNNTVLTILTFAVTAIILFTSGDLADASHLSGQSGFLLSGSVLHIFELLLPTMKTLVVYLFSRIEYLSVFLVLSFLLGLCVSVRISGKTVIAAAVVLMGTAIAVLLINSLIGFMPPRVISIPLAWIFLALMLILLYAGSLIRSGFSIEIGSLVISGAAALSLLTVALFFYSGNISNVLDIRTAWIERDRVLSSLDHSGQPIETCAIPVMGSSRADPSDDPMQDFNIVTAYYYGFTAITADHLCSPFE